MPLPRQLSPPVGYGVDGARMLAWGGGSPRPSGALGMSVSQAVMLLVPNCESISPTWTLRRQRWSPALAHRNGSSQYIFTQTMDE